MQYFIVAHFARLIAYQVMLMICSAWIKDWEHPLMTKVTKRVRLVTGLKAVQPKEAEDYQVQLSNWIGNIFFDVITALNMY